MLSKKLKKAFERECFILRYYDNHRRFPSAKRKIMITLSFETLEKFQDKIKKREFSSFVEQLISQSITQK